MAWLEVIGSDAGAPDSLPLPQRYLLEQADVVAAPRRLLPALAHLPGRRMASDGSADCLEALAAAMARGERVVLLASGDPLWFGIGRRLLMRMGGERVRFHPAASSLQLAFARLQRPWQNASWVSLHGRDPDALVEALRRRPTELVVLTDPDRGGAEAVRQVLQGLQLSGSYTFWLLEQLGHPEERVRPMDSSRPIGAHARLHLVVLLARQPGPTVTLPVLGIPDGLWLHDPDRPGLMTKREVRIQLLADLALPSQGILWDLGAGVGSVGLEALRLSPGLSLWAVERRGGSAALIQRNAERFGVDQTRLHCLEADALAVLKTLPEPDRVLLGGGGKDRTELCVSACRRLGPGGVIVIPLATLEAFAVLQQALQAEGLHLGCTQLQASRGLALVDGTRLAPMNPVLILRGRKPG